LKERRTGVGRAARHKPEPVLERIEELTKRRGTYNDEIGDKGPS